MQRPLDARDVNTAAPSPAEIELSGDLARVGVPETCQDGFDLSRADLGMDPAPAWPRFERTVASVSPNPPLNAGLANREPFSYRSVASFACLVRLDCAQPQPKGMWL